MSDRKCRHRPSFLALLTAVFALTLIVIDSLKLTSLILVAIAAAFILAVAGPGLVLVDDGLLMRCQVSHEAKSLMNLLGTCYCSWVNRSCFHAWGFRCSLVHIIVDSLGPFFAGLCRRNPQR